MHDVSQRGHKLTVSWIHYTMHKKGVKGSVYSMWDKKLSTLFEYFNNKLIQRLTLFDGHRKACCLFRLAFGCCALQTLVKILIFSVFNDEKLKKGKNYFTTFYIWKNVFLRNTLPAFWNKLKKLFLAQFGRKFPDFPFLLAFRH